MGEIIEFPLERRRSTVPEQRDDSVTGLAARIEADARLSAISDKLGPVATKMTEKLDAANRAAGIDGYASLFFGEDTPWAEAIAAGEDEKAAALRPIDWNGHIG